MHIYNSYSPGLFSSSYVQATLAEVSYFVQYRYQWRRKVPKSTGGGGGGWVTQTYIYVPLLKNQYKRGVIDIWLFT